MQRSGNQIRVLAQLIDSNWRYYWWLLEHSPIFRPLQNRAELQDMIQRLNDGVRVERDYFEAHRETPLLDSLPTSR